MILAGASCDDIYVIVLFSTFVGMAQGGSANMMDFVNIRFPLCSAWRSARLSVCCCTCSLRPRTARLLCPQQYQGNPDSRAVVPADGGRDMAQRHRVRVRTVGRYEHGVRPQDQKSGKSRKRLSAKFGKLWIAAEAIFVLVRRGCGYPLRLASAAAVLMIALALVFRAVGVSRCMLGTRLNRKERLFCVIAYLPKATVQAAIGSVPLSMGLPCGQLVLSVAVLAILITAPLGAIGIDRTAGRLLMQENSSDIAE